MPSRRGQGQLYIFFTFFYTEAQNTSMKLDVGRQVAYMSP